MAGPTSHRPWDWLELVSDRKDGDHSVCSWLSKRAWKEAIMELDESISKLTEAEGKALPRRSLHHQNRYCQSLRLRWLGNKSPMYGFVSINPSRGSPHHPTSSMPVAAWRHDGNPTAGGLPTTQPPPCQCAVAHGGWMASMNQTMTH